MHLSFQKPIPRCRVEGEPSISVEDLHQLHETEALFHSNWIRLQIEELLKEVKVNGKKELELAEEVIACIKAPASIKEVTRRRLKKAGIQIPLPILMTTEDEDMGIPASSPIDHLITGSAILQTAIKQHRNVDVAFFVPPECLHHRDFLNHEYLQKRALYLGFLAYKLKKAALPFALKFAFCDDISYPFLLVAREGNDSALEKHHRCVVIDVLPPPEYFKDSRFIPSRNNVRPSWYSTGFDVDLDEAEEIGTPHYNALISRDLTMRHCRELLVDRFSNNSALQDALILFKVWLLQRDLLHGSYGMSGFQASLLFAYLDVKRMVNPQMSSYQILRNAWNFLWETDWSKTGISLFPETQAHEMQPTIDDFHKHFDVVFIDPSGFHNVCAFLDRCSYHELRFEAHQALLCLDNHHSEAIEVLFTSQSPFLLRHDTYFKVNIEEPLQLLLQLGGAEKALDQGPRNLHHATCQMVTQLLTKALGNRIRGMGVLRGMNSLTWSVDEKAPEFSCTFIVGLRLDPTEQLRIIDKGPAADSHQALEFREFWGERSEWRRFPDGSTCEAVVWVEERDAVLCQRRVILPNIVTYILEKKAGLQPCFFLLPLQDILKNPPYRGTGEEESLAAIQGLGELRKKLLELSDLPLKISSLQGVSPVFAYSEVFPPLPGLAEPSIPVSMKSSSCATLTGNLLQAPDWLPPLKALIRLETSGKWPDDVEAIRRLKAAFYVELSKRLRKSRCLCHALPDRLWIVLARFVFELRVTFAGEATVHQKERDSTGFLRLRETPESRAVTKDTVAKPYLSSALHSSRTRSRFFFLSLQVEHLCWSTGVRLCKRWVASHMLGPPHVPWEVVELLSAHCLISSHQFPTPASPEAIFLRFLQLLSYHDWETSPILVNFNSTLSKEDVREIRNHFDKQRATLPPVFIATPLDRYASEWSREVPTPMILRRLASLAQSALALLTSSSVPSDFKVLFYPILDAFDVLIWLRHSQLPRRREALLDEGTSICTPQPLQSSQDSYCIPIVEFDPVQCYLEELRGLYGELALFFHDEHGGDVIGVLWKPDAWKPTEFKVLCPLLRSVKSMEPMQ
ncbi:unnamed protein product [Darwinula stevensoni]|uniref:Nucleolar protein 6 n=1 Tax=Darwinula stevensoni TaxID=69355 RepID=A0A7R8XCD2_9CRUS|nr:unnamed protein product [Darwinula stevensoni]CAG0892048.1 unnamed protein product [Darwinula stevensoni]